MTHLAEPFPQHEAIAQLAAVRFFPAFRILRLVVPAVIALASLLCGGCQHKTSQHVTIPPSLPKIEYHGNVEFVLGTCDNGTPILFGAFAPATAPTSTPCQPATKLIYQPILSDNIDHKSEFLTGTLVAVSFSTYRAVIAADSRSIHYADGDPAGFDDKSCKIALLNPYLAFAVTGIATSPTLPETISVNAFDVARRVSFLSAVHFFLGVQPSNVPKKTPFSHNLVQQIAYDWGTAMALRYIRGVRIGAMPTPSRSNPILVRGIFLGSDEDGELRLAAAEVTYSAPREGFIVTSANPTVDSVEVRDDSTLIEVYGQTKVAVRYVYPDSVTAGTLRDYEKLVYAQAADPRYFPERIPIAFLEKIIRKDQTRAYPGGPKIIGGPIDAVAIDKGGSFRWLTRKADCPEEGISVNDRSK